MKEYRKPLVTMPIGTAGLIPLAVAAVEGVAAVASAIGGVAVAAGAVGAAAGLMKDDRFQMTALRALNPVTA